MPTADTHGYTLSNLNLKTLTTFTQFKALVQLQLNHKTKAIQADGGGEFIPFTRYLAQFGITHRLTCPYTHKQNWYVEC